MLKKIEAKERIKQGRTWGRRLLAFVLCFALSFSLMPTALALRIYEEQGMSSALSKCSSRTLEEAKDLAEELYEDKVLPEDDNDSDWDDFYEYYWKQYSRKTGLTGDGKIFDTTGSYRYEILEGEALNYYYSLWLNRWWDALSADKQEEHLKAWAQTAKRSGVTQADKSSIVKVQVTKAMLKEAKDTNDWKREYCDYLEGGELTLPRTAADYYWILIGGQSPSWSGEESDGGQAVKNTYLMRVDTGVNPGTNVLYLGVRYTDVQGVERTEFLFPHENSMQDGFALAEKYGTPKARQELVESVTGYKTQNSYSTSDGLRAYSYDYYLFSPHYELKEFLGIDVFLRYPMNRSYTKGWTCAGLYFYRVDELYGIDMAGYYSDNYYISFKGEMMSRLEIQGSGGVVDFELDRSDILYRLGREADTGYTLDTVNQPYDSRADEFLFKIDFADVAGGGVEALAANYSSSGDRRLSCPIEAMTLRVTYLDSLGEERTVDMPVITSMLTWAVEKGALNASLPIAGIAQQGESVMFPGRLPDFVEFKTVTLIYGSDAAQKARLVEPSSGGYASRIKELTNDSINIAGFQIYNADVGVSLGANSKLTNYAMLDLVVNNTAAPEYYYTGNNVSGMMVKPGRSVILSDLMRPYTPGTSLKPKQDPNNYIVVITTDDMDRAGTQEDIHLRIGYVSTTGSPRETDAISLREAAQNYYGYWPGINGDAAYTGAMCAKGQLVISLPIADVNKFTSATFIMNTHATDDWQMKDIKIYNISEIGSRQIVWEFTGFSDRRISRPFNESEENIVARYPNLLDDAEDSKVYLGGNVYTQTIYFGEDAKSVIEQNQEKLDWSEIRYSMTIKEAMQDLGFARADSTYRVDVKVASNSESSMDSGDCGSQNLFYFKLNFEGGSSGYVLANQQLTADGFRADRTETFYIATNEDYGALSAISIIPEDDSGSDNQDPFDKLNISNIVVSKETSGGVAKAWRVENVGWVDVNYRDKGAESTASGRPGRTEGEIAHSYPVTSQGYSMNLLFAMSTGSYDKSSSASNYDITTVNPTYRGSMVATIEYYDTSGMLRKQSVDVVRAMYEYAARNPEYYSETYRASDGNNETRAKSDPSFMFRGGHVDRFYVMLTDVKQIVRVRMGLSSEVATTWKLDRLDVYQLCSDGVLQLTATDEYRRTNKVEPLCVSTEDSGYALFTMAPENSMQTLGEEQSMVVNMTANTIDVKMEGSNWTSAITREPNNKNDMLNIYVYMGESEVPISEYDMNCSVVWGNANTAGAQTSAVGKLDKAPDANMFYYTGFKVSGISALYGIALKGSYREVLNARIDHVVIQHVRSGVTIGSYYFYVNASAENQANLTYDPENPGVDTDVTAHGKQVVKLFFAPNMEEMLLSPDVSDIAVAIRYRTTNDTEKDGIGEGTYYNSAYEFLSKLKLTDEKGAKYTRITPGMVAEVEFNEPYIGEIVGITLATVGNAKAELDSACVGVYTDSSGKASGWYDFANGAVLSTTPYTLQASSKSVTPVELTFTTNKDATTVSSGADSGLTCPIRMTVVYTSAQTGGREEITFSDIRKYLVSGDFGTGNTATIQMFMRDVSALRFVTLEPYTIDTASSAIWGLTDVSCKAIVNGEVKSSGPVTVNRLIAEDSPVSVNFSEVYMKLKVSAYNDTSGVTVERNTDVNGSTEIAVKSGGNVTITPTLVGSLDGYGYQVSATSESGAEVFCYKDSGGKIVFTAPENTSGSVVKYNVTVSSEESPSIKCSVLINVESKPVEKELPVTPEWSSEETPSENTPSEPTPEPAPESSGEPTT